MTFTARRICTRIPVLALAFTLSACLPAYSSPITTSITYDLTDVTASNGDTLTGTVTIDTTSNKVTAADITFNDAAVGDPVFTDIGRPNSWGTIGQDYISGPKNSPLNYGGQIGLYYDTTNISTGGDLAICVISQICGTNYGSYSTVQAYGRNGGPFYLSGGSLDPIVEAPSTPLVPEPVPLVLLGTGIAGAAFLARYRFNKA